MKFFPVPPGCGLIVSLPGKGQLGPVERVRAGSPDHQTIQVGGHQTSYPSVLGGSAGGIIPG